MTSMHAASVTEPATTPPSETVLRAREVFSEGLAEVQQFAADTMALSPEELAVRAGLTLAVIVGAALALWLLRFIFKSIAKRLAPPEDAAPRKRVKIGGWTMLIARPAIWVLAFLLVLQIWGVGSRPRDGGPVRLHAGRAGRAALTIIVMLAAIDLARMAIHRLFGRMSDRARTPRRAAQIRTVAPVVGGIVTSVLVVIATMMVLSNVGIEIGPLLAGAGIVGLAVGFGAQTLVKDFLTGFFLIIEDVVSVGDVAKIGDASGVVEDMSMRTIKLRAFDGTLQVIPMARRRSSTT
ncbi:MAG: mechanosensitive ion channel [Hyphomonadaceae bacterium]